MLDEKRSVILADLFLFFFGIWGAHRFYLGKWFSGILYSFSWGFLGLGLIYDFFTLPFQVMSVNRTL